MKMFKRDKGMPLLKVYRHQCRQQRPGREHGAALIAAIFIITSLAALGGFMSQMLAMGSEETLNEWYSSQALYAAESGVDWSVYNNGSATVLDQTVVTDRVWFEVEVTSRSFAGGKTLYIISSTGKAGGTAASPRAQRKIVVQYMP